MKIEVLPQEDHQVQLKIEVEEQQLTQAKQKAARKMAQKAKIPGFRPGKAPYPVILRHFGEGAVTEEAIEILANDIYPKALDEQGIKAYGPGSLQNIPSTEPLILEFLVPLEAEVTLGDYLNVRLPYEPPEVTEDEVNEVVRNLQNNNAVIESVDRPAQKGDQVTILLEANRLNLESGEETGLISQRSVPIVIPETDDPEEWPFPGFSLSLLDCSVGDTKKVVHTFAEDTAYQQLVGVEAEFIMNVEGISSRTLPALDDEFSKLVGDFDTFDALLVDIRTSIEDNKKSRYDAEYQEDVLQEMVKGSEVKYSSAMVESEIDVLMENLGQRLNEQQMDIDLYLKTRQMDMEALREENRPNAEERLKRSLVIYEIATSEEIKISQEELSNETSRTVDYLSNVLDQKGSRRLSNRNVINNIASNVMVDLLTRKTLAKVKEIGSGMLGENEQSEEPDAETIIEADGDKSDAVKSPKNNEKSVQASSKEEQDASEIVELDQKIGEIEEPENTVESEEGEK